MRLMLVIAAASAATASPATASVYSDDLTRCLVKSTPAADRAVLMRWLFLAMSASPVARGLSTATPSDRTAANRAAASLIQKLLTSDCRKEAVEALKFDGPQAIGEGFNFLGQVAAKDLTSDPAVTAEMENMASFVDEKKWLDLAKEAGLKVDTSSAEAADTKAPQ